MTVPQCCLASWWAKVAGHLRRSWQSRGPSPAAGPPKAERRAALLDRTSAIRTQKLPHAAKQPTDQLPAAGALVSDFKHNCCGRCDGATPS